MQLQEDKITTLQTAIQTAYLDHTINSSLAYRPEFISNNYKLGKKVLVSIEEELQRCEEFCISVAFITKSGITPLLQTLKNLEQRNIPGKILTTNYLMFSEPEALEKLAGLKNIELRMYVTNAETGGFHTKGYIFRKEEIYRIIIGSSNMTLSAITKNKEWNTKIVSTEQGELAQAVLQEFDELWQDEHTLAFEDFIDSYRQDYLAEKMIRKQKQQAVSESVVELENYRLKPNKMQIAFVKNVMEMRAHQIDRALLLSSTGTGKSLASAFMLREMETRRALFVVHREQIAKTLKELATRCRTRMSPIVCHRFKTADVVVRFERIESGYQHMETISVIREFRELKRFHEYFAIRRNGRGKMFKFGNVNTNVNHEAVPPFLKSDTVIFTSDYHRKRD